MRGKEGTVEQDRRLAGRRRRERRDDEGCPPAILVEGAAVLDERDGAAVGKADDAAEGVAARACPERCVVGLARVAVGPQPLLEDERHTRPTVTRAPLALRTAAPAPARSRS